MGANRRLSLVKMLYEIMNRIFRLSAIVVLFSIATLWPESVVVANDLPEPLDCLTFAQGALLVSVNGGGPYKVNSSHGNQMIDGNPMPFVFASLAGKDATIDFIYQLPAETTFNRFAVPNIWETPSPSQTFIKHVEIFGAMNNSDDAYELLAKGQLATHTSKGQQTEIPLMKRMPVVFVKVRLSGGIDLQREKSFLEFSEVIGNGEQASTPLSQAFHGEWRVRGVKIILNQDQTVVTGCYDNTGELTGTVSGKILRARGLTDNGIESLFILLVDDKGGLQGLRSTNGAPFRSYIGEPVNGNIDTPCGANQPDSIGCGSIIHAVQFDYDSAEIRPESKSVIDALSRGLKQPAISKIIIEGHTSSDGSEAYNASLSERRAKAVVDALAGRGIDLEHLRAIGVGEARPIASNEDEAGRSINRRVEVHCQP